jgi:hypothetical protein
MPHPRRSPIRRRRAALLIATFLAPVLHACDRNHALAPARGFGAFEGRWDGSPWIGQGYAVLLDDTLYVTGHRPDPRVYYDEFVQVRVPFAGAGTYAVDSLRGTLEQVTGGDAGYFVRARGELRVTSFDAVAGRVRGTVQLAAVGPHFGWRFEGGEFDVPLYVRWSDRPLIPPR